MITLAPSTSRRRAKKAHRLVALAASVPVASGFAILPPRTILRDPSLINSRRGSPQEYRLPSFLHFTDNDANDTTSLERNDGASPSKKRIPFVVKSNEKIEDNASTDTEEESSTKGPLPTNISAAIQEVLTTTVRPQHDEEDPNHPKRLIIPIGSTKVPSDSKHSEKGASEPRTNNTTPSTLFRSLELKKAWGRLRPGQKFRFRLGFGILAFVSLWNTVIVRNYSGFISGIVTGAAATTTATGFGGLLGRWLSSRGFQGIAALGRSVAYGWAILVAYPRMLDRRAKDRKQKREEESLKQWRMYLKGTADEVVRLKRELSLIEGEIRTFRREILAIRAARIPNNETQKKADSDDDHTSNNNTMEDSSDRILREAILTEMTHLSRLRDDTRRSLATARQRLSEVRAKKPITQTSNPSTFDPFLFELEAAADLDYYDPEHGHDDLLLKGL